MARVHIPLTLDGEAAGFLDFEIENEGSGAGRVEKLEVHDEALRAELEHLLAPGNPRQLRVRSTIDPDLSRTLDGIVVALDTLAADEPRFRFDASETVGRFGTLWSRPGIVG